MEKIIKYLNEYPVFRERKNKDFLLVQILQKHYPELSQVPQKTLVNALKEYTTMDRSWRKVLAENPHLRGTDYDQKAILEEQKQVELGYAPGYHQDVQKIKNQ